MEQFSNLLKEPTDSNAQQPQHLYRLRGVATNSHTTYFLQGKGDTGSDTTETPDGSQWWMTKYDVRPEIVKQVRFPNISGQIPSHLVASIHGKQKTDPTIYTANHRSRCHQSRGKRGQRSPPCLCQQQSINTSRRRRRRLSCSAEGWSHTSGNTFLTP